MNPGVTPSREDILPPDEPPFAGVIGTNYRDSTPDWPATRRPGDGAPNILVVLLDDLGFGQLSCYGGPVKAPNIARLAAGGLRYNNFHTISLCSPSRAALLTGRNHHSVGFAAITEIATGYPGSNAYLPKSASTIAEVLKQSGYFTMCVGKWHLTPTTQSTPAGPFDRWPLGQGFERFYGFMPGETDHWHPILTCDNHRIPVPEHPGYHLSEDLADQAIRMLREQQQVATGRPFFTYLAFGAPHAPFQVAREWIDAYRGCFDHGWDVQRELTLARQISMGIVPPGTELPPRNPGIAAWSDLSADARRLYARLQEAFCGFMDHCDAQIGRVIAAIEQLGQLDNTLIMVLSDNGASQEGQAHGTTNTERFRNLMPMGVQEMMADLERIGGPDTDPHYPSGWGMAGNTPFKRWKRDTHRGGNTDPLIVHWPQGLSERGAIRTQYHHITDLYPTLLEVAGVAPPSIVNGVPQKPLEGLSLRYTFNDGIAPTRKRVQYYEMLGCRALWRDGWTAVAWHESGSDWNNDVWELYHQDEDFAQCRDLAAQYPEKLRALVDDWWVEAKAHNVLPLDDRLYLRALDPNRPKTALPQPRYRYWPDSSPVPMTALPPLLNRSHRVDALVEIPPEGAQGVLASVGGAQGGWSLFVQDGRAHYVHNFLRIRSHKVSTLVLPVGRLEVGFVFTPTGKGLGTVQMFVNGTSQGAPQPVETAPIAYSAVQDGLQVGRQWGPPVAYEDYHGSFAFTGRLEHVDLTWPAEPGA
jgi:arylsulfatase A-like enzyme